MYQVVICKGGFRKYILPHNRSDRPVEVWKTEKRTAKGIAAADFFDQQGEGADANFIVKWPVRCF